MASRSRASAEIARLAGACLALLAAVAGAQPLPCAETDKECALKAAVAHPVRRIESWAKTLALPVEQRIGPAPAALVQFLALDNIANGFPERPRAAVLPDDFLDDVKKAMNELPASVKRALGKDFAGLYFVEDLGGTGYTDYVSDGSRIAGAFTVLDAAILRKWRANEWATWKENTPFSPQPGFALEARIAEPESDDRRNAIQYILLHELGHVMSAEAKVHPPWNMRPASVPAGSEPRFFLLSWRIDRAKNRYESAFDSVFPKRAQVVYYLKPQLRAGEAAEVYRQLEGTNFPTLYAATRPGDDFAEAFANYVHVVMLKKPFEIVIRESGRITRRYGACWAEVRCAAKRRILEDLLGD
jgi:hypothetical protein